MKKINSDNWKEFKIGDLFEISPTEAYKKINKSFLIEDDGTTPVVTNKQYNNGILGYSSLEPTEEGNIITFSDTTTADAVFYQPNPFIGFSHIQGMYPKDKYKDKWTEDSLLFLVAIIKKNARLMGFDFSYKFTREILSNMIIKLPIDKNEEINWNYMEKYMQKIKENIKIKINKLKLINVNNHLKNIDEWKRFHIYDEKLFEIDNGTKLDKSKMTEFNPTINFVSRSNKNNGIVGKVDKIDNLNIYNEGNLTLALGGEYLGSCFIQKEKFYTAQNVAVLKPRWNMSFNIKLFISTMIFNESRQYYKAFVDELNKHIKKDFSFYLPITKDGEIDFDYMESCIEQYKISAKNIVYNLEK